MLRRVVAFVGLLACGRSAAPPKDLETRRVELKDELRQLAKELEQQGRYDCCVEAACTQCALRMGGCACGESLRKGGPVCEECALMWMSGRGAEAGVDPASVRSYLEAGREEVEKAHGGPACGCPEGTH
jgi:hypothetical protein